MQFRKIVVFSFLLTQLYSLLLADEMKENKKTPQVVQKKSIILSAAFASISGDSNWKQTTQDYSLMFSFPSSETFEISEIIQFKKYHTEDNINNIFPEKLSQLSFITLGKFEKSNFMFFVNSSSNEIFHSNNELNFFASFFYPISQSKNSSFSLGIIYGSGYIFDDLPSFPIPFFSYFYMNDEIFLMLGINSKATWKIIPKYLTLELEGMPLTGNYFISLSSFPMNFFQIKGVFAKKEDIFALSHRNNEEEKFAYLYIETGLEVSFFISRYTTLSFYSGYRFQSKEEYYMKENILSSKKTRISENIPDSWNYKVMLKIMF